MPRRGLCPALAGIPGQPHMIHCGAAWQALSPALTGSSGNGSPVNCALCPLPGLRQCLWLSTWCQGTPSLPGLSRSLCSFLQSPLPQTLQPSNGPCPCTLDWSSALPPYAIPPPPHPQQKEHPTMPAVPCGPCQGKTAVLSATRQLGSPLFSTVIAREGGEEQDLFCGTLHGTGCVIAGDVGHALRLGGSRDIPKEIPGRFLLFSSLYK